VEIIPCRNVGLEEIAAGLAAHPSGVILEPLVLQP
jgi:hypothetical protein